MEDQQMTLNSGEYFIKECEKLIAEYKACQTVHQRTKLIPRIEYMMKRLSFEKEQLDKLIYGN